MVSLYRDNRDDAVPYFFVVVQVAMTDPLGVVLLKQEYPEGRLLKKAMPGNRQDQFYFQIHNLQAARFLEEIEPFVLVKWEQVKIARSFLAHAARFQAAKAQGRGPSRKEYEKRANALKDKMHALKRETKGVNSVNLLLRHELRKYRAKPEDVLSDVEFGRTALEGVETRLTERNKARSAPEKDIVQIPSS